MNIAIQEHSQPLIIDGKATAQTVLDEIKSEVQQMKAQGIEPCLAVVLVGDDPASHVYVRNKVEKALYVGIRSLEYRMSADTDADTLLQKIDELNALDQQLNASVKQYKQRFQPHLFHKGLFNGKQILIYEFESEDDLRLTLAHELGHALGLQHTDDPHALMHPVMKDQDIAHFRLTQADRDLLLAR